MAVLVGTDQDFYSLLGVSSTASSRELHMLYFLWEKYDNYGTKGLADDPEGGPYETWDYE